MVSRTAARRRSTGRSSAYTDGGPPIVLGGGGGRALERAGQRADAWISTPGAPDDIAANYQRVRAAADTQARALEQLAALVDIVF